MVSKEYLSTARTLLRIARNMTDGAIANRLKALAEDYERRAQRGEFAESAKGRSLFAAIRPPDLMRGRASIDRNRFARLS
jgi:hypothetical protein